MLCCTAQNFAYYALINAQYLPIMLNILFFSSHALLLNLQAYSMAQEFFPMCCSMFSSTYYAQKYAGIISGSLTQYIFILSHN